MTKNERARERERERKRKRERERERERERKRKRERERKRKRERKREKKRERETHPYETCPQEHESRHTIDVISVSNHTCNADPNTLLYMCIRCGPYMCDWVHAHLYMYHVGESHTSSHM